MDGTTYYVNGHIDLKFEMEQILAKYMKVEDLLSGHVQMLGFLNFVQNVGVLTRWSGPNQ